MARQHCRDLRLSADCSGTRCASLHGDQTRNGLGDSLSCRSQEPVDSLTHIYFAHKLLSAVGGAPAAAVCALFPQIDREPAYFHRMYGHPFFQIGKLVDIGTEVYSQGRIPPEREDDYAWARFLHERPRMLSFVEVYELERGMSLGDFEPEHRASALIAYVSHTYQDIFNNPMQAFLPRFVYPSGKWDLWATLGAVDFRAVLYAPAVISEFRREFFEDPLWETDLDAGALLTAMIERTAAASVVPVGREIIDAAYEALGMDSVPSENETTRASQFLIDHEQLLSQLMGEYSQPARVFAFTGGSARTASYPVGS